MDIDWVDLLLKLGDPTEQKGIKECGLGQSFPKYAEFWGRYVLPNRDASDHSKLRSGLDPKLEDIFNNHYGVFYQLTTALYQLKNLDNPILDVATPFYHLGAAIDLTERTFVAALFAKNLNVEKLDEDAFNTIVKAFWEKDYESRFNAFEKRYKPVTIDLQSVSSTFKENFANSENFEAIANNIRNYRNVLIHSLPPLKIQIQNEIYIPEQRFLQNYTQARWSSERAKVDPKHYKPAKEVIGDLANKLIISLNKLWEVLLNLMSEIPINKDEEHTRTSISELFEKAFGEAQMGRASGVDFIIDETEETSDWLKRSSPTNPSGYKVDNDGDPIL